MRPYDLIKRKRDGGTLTSGEIEAFLRSYTDGEIPDYQAAALLMAIFFRGLDEAELAAWTRSMLESGVVLDLSEIPGTKVDKHSTGGVGDKVSIALAPLVAAFGVPVPMIVGRGLGHTGGTVDKLRSIPGFSTELPIERFRLQIAELGTAIIGQTEQIAPADRRLYALRDATATVESIPLIASSILSKKLAEGSDAIVFDVKVGAGAFMKDQASARLLARTMIEIGTSLGRRVVALLTAMDQPLGRAVGNALEVREAIELLHGRGPADLERLTVELGAEMLVLGGAAKEMDQGRVLIRGAIGDGRGLAMLERLIEAQGGDPSVVSRPQRLPAAPKVIGIKASRSGIVSAIHAEEVGLAAVGLGAGRARKEDSVDPAVGFVLLAKVGAEVKEGEVIAEVHVGHDPRRSEEAIARLGGAITIADEKPAFEALLIERLA